MLTGVSDAHLAGRATPVSVRCPACGEHIEVDSRARIELQMDFGHTSIVVDGTTVHRCDSQPESDGISQR